MGITYDAIPRQCTNRQNKTLTMLTEQERIDIVRYRIKCAENTLGEIENLFALKYYNNAANRMYYACYYAVSALLIANNISTKSHDGVMQMFGLHFIRTGIFPTYYGKYYSQLFNERQTGDYEDLFNHDEVSTAELYPKAKELVAAIKVKVDQWLAENAK